MSISYEEALATLQAMFGEPWTRETLDVVLRNQQGHMENTVDLILRHVDKEPQVLVEMLEAGIDPEESARSMDELLARQLQNGQGSAARAVTAGTAPSIHRGTPTKLPDDFLRIPGGSSLVDDEALARMLQDELFSQELARNPDFAHLARGGAGAAQRFATNRTQATSRASANNNAPPNLNLPSTAQIMGKLSEMGDGARRRLLTLAEKFKQNTAAEQTAPPAAAQERRGLLDDDDMNDMELAARKDL